MPRVERRLHKRLCYGVQRAGTGKHDEGTKLVVHVADPGERLVGYHAPASTDLWLLAGSSDARMDRPPGAILLGYGLRPEPPILAGADRG